MAPPHVRVCVCASASVCVERHPAHVPPPQVYFDQRIDEEKYCGYLFGLGNTYCSNGNGYTVTDSSQ